MNSALVCLLSASTAFSAVKSDSSPGPLADIGPAPAVSLIDAAGRPFELASLRGEAVVVSFIYTTCNGSCPATTHTLYRVQEVLKDAGLWGGRVHFVSITLDPARDTPEVLGRYAKIYDADPAAWHFLSGPPDRVAQTLAAWDMWARTNAAGVLDHPSRIFLVDPRGRRREIYNLEFLTPESVLQDVRTILAEEDGR
jgi:protein SCO1/2